MTMSLNVGKAFDKIQYAVMIKILKLRIERELSQLDKQHL